MQRFWSKVRKGPDCWEWQAARTTWNYGAFWYKGRDVGAHRVAWELAHGDPGEFQVLHTCDNPPCVRPDHLFLGTQAANMRDMQAKGRSLVGEAHPQAKLSVADVVLMRAMYAEQRGDQVTLAAYFGVSPDTVSRILSGKNWVK